MLVERGGRIVLTKAEEVGESILDDLGDIQHLAVPAFEDLWDNPEDEVWDEA